MGNMAANPLSQLAERQIILASAEIEADIRGGSGAVVGIWQQLRKNAVISLEQLVTLSVYDPKERQLIVTHQNEVKRYVEFSHCLVALFHNGKELYRQLTEKDRRALIELIKDMPEDERPDVELGINRDELEPSFD